MGSSIIFVQGSPLPTHAWRWDPRSPCPTYLLCLLKLDRRVIVSTPFQALNFRDYTYACVTVRSEKPLPHLSSLSPTTVTKTGPPNWSFYSISVSKFLGLTPTHAWRLTMRSQMPLPHISSLSLDTVIKTGLPDQSFYSISASEFFKLTPTHARWLDLGCLYPTNLLCLQP